MKRVTAIILAAMIVLSLAACGGGREAADNTEPPENGAEDPSDTNNETEQPGDTGLTPEESIKTLSLIQTEKAFSGI